MTASTRCLLRLHPLARPVALACCTLALACSVYDESLLSRGAAPDASARCTRTTWPGRPAGSALGGGIDFVVALRRFDLGEKYDPRDGSPVLEERAVGYDLDGRCTGDTETVDPLLTDDNACSAAGDWFDPVFGDLPGGRDNSLRHVINFVATYFTGFGTPSYNAAIESGEVSLLVHVKDYNGQANDDSVQFVLYTPTSFDRANSAPPRFLGDDVWPIASISYVNPETREPRYVSRAAWVRDGTLVAGFPNVDFRLRIGIAAAGVADLNFRFLDAFITAKLTQDAAERWVLSDGQIAARWKTKDVFDQTKFYPNPFPSPTASKNMCLHTPGYGLTHNAICQATDSYSGSSNSPGLMCDSISVGIAFETVPAKIGATFDLPERVTDCGEFDPGKDSCERSWDQQVAAGILDAGAGAGDGAAP
ncbi:MAG TPA: hypothetical protein VK524_23120 [Polyangiaceae bacterium]|nr:hypothetical protein [Polyangiaceae bacterium]